MPHAWRIAFSRFFPGPDALVRLDRTTNLPNKGLDTMHPERRAFARLTTLASWRSEYILRTLLLRSLARGKPFEPSEQGGHGHPPHDYTNGMNGQITYHSKLLSSISHLQATFGTGTDKKPPRFIHGADGLGSVSVSDSRNGKVDQWGFADTQVFSQFVDEFPGDAQYGLGPGEVVGVPNIMSVSQLHGMVYAEGYPGGSIYYRSVDEKRGRALALFQGFPVPELGIPGIQEPETVCSVWIAKNSNVPGLSGGLIGILAGSSHGIVSAYSLGTQGLRGRRLERGEITARWVLSPGVPIIAIAVDEDLSLGRQANHRVWAVVLNALGEVYYLIDTPVRPIDDRAKLNEQQIDQLAWETGRSVYWTLIEETRRISKPDPFREFSSDSSLSPRSSWNGMGLSQAQIGAGTKEIEAFINQKPKHFRKICENWDMQRRLEVDFAAGDEGGAGEGIVVIGCGLNEGQNATIKRFTRHKLFDTLDDFLDAVGTQTTDHLSVDGEEAFSSFSPSLSAENHAGWSFEGIKPARRSSASSFQTLGLKSTMDEWRTSVLLLNGVKAAQISTTALDLSTLAALTAFEDPLLSMRGSSAGSSTSSSPIGQTQFPGSPSSVPGQRARLMAVGTKTGNVLIWNIRAPASDNKAIEGIISPVRIIHTDSPQVTCLALSALYLVHGGNDGLVQAWDPLASSRDPIRTLNSRFSSRARRRLIQAEASAQGESVNLFAAGALCLDPDPTSLRGIVSLGAHLRYWSYTSSAVEQYKTTKRRLRRSARRSNQRADGFSSTGRGYLKEYIITEKTELEQEKKSQHKERQRLIGRFGLNLLGPGASEDEILAYATMLSEETAASDEQRRSESESSISSETVVQNSKSYSSPISKAEDIDADIAEAIRLSLQDDQDNSAMEIDAAGSSSPCYSIKYAKSRKSPVTSPPKRPFGGGTLSSALDDFDFATRLSLMKEKANGNEPEEKKGKEVYEVGDEESSVGN